MRRQKLAKHGRAVYPDSVGVDALPQRSVLGMIVRDLSQGISKKRRNFLGSRCTRCTHEGVPLNFVGVQEMDLREGRFRHEVQDVRARSAQANNRNPLFADAVLRY